MGPGLGMDLVSSRALSRAKGGHVIAARRMLHAPRMVPVPCIVACMLASQAGLPDSLRLSASVDAYAALNTNDPADGASFIPGTGTTAKRANEASLNLATVGVDLAPSPLGFHLLLGAGAAMEVEHAGEPTGIASGPDVWRFVQRASLELDHGPLAIEAGIYPSHIGLESFQSQLNWAYTRSWMGELSPYYQTGLKVAYALSPRWSAQLHLMNGWQVIGDDNRAKAVGTQLAYADERLSFAFNTFAGPEGTASRWRLFADGVATINVTPRLSFAGSADLGWQRAPSSTWSRWGGVNLNARYLLTRALALSVRGEWFRDPGEVVSGAAQTLAEATVTLAYSGIDHLVLKLEARHDHANARVFSGRAGPDGATALDRAQTLVVLGAVASY